MKNKGVPFFFKSWGKYKGPNPGWYVPAGHLLDGRTHDDLPWINLADDGKGREVDHEIIR